MSSWFQVCCPVCEAALQVRLPAGRTPVRCSLLDCNEVFSVYVDAGMLQDGEAAAVPFRRQRARPVGGAAEQASLATRRYREWQKITLPRVMKEYPGIRSSWR